MSDKNEKLDPDDYMTRKEVDKEVANRLFQHDVVKSEKKARKKYQDYDEVSGTFFKVLDGNPGLQQKYWEEVAETGDVENAAEVAYQHGQALRKAQGEGGSQPGGSGESREKDTDNMTFEEWGKLSQEERDKLTGIK